MDVIYMVDINVHRAKFGINGFLATDISIFNWERIGNILWDVNEYQKRKSEKVVIFKNINYIAN